MTNYLSELLHSNFISIHTPAKGVTTYTENTVIRTAISIHTPAKGVTPYYDADKRTIKISIHTPAKGVTGHLLIWRVDKVNFNPHSREGSDPSATL